MADETESRTPTPGSIPTAYRNALFWRWAPALKKVKGIPGGFTCVLYAMASAANAAGRVQFKDGKPIRITDIARGAQVDEKDARRYIEAAIAAGVLDVIGERKRGRAALYALLVSPFPDWGAAAHALESSRRVRKPRDGNPREAAQEQTPADGEYETGREEDPDAFADDSEFGGQPPNFEDPEFGGQPPNFWEGMDWEVRGAAPDGVRGAAPEWFGGQPPNNPCSNQEVPHDMADVVTQAEVPRARAAGEKIDSTGEERWGCGTKRCARCHGRMANRPDRVMCVSCMREETRSA